MNEEVNLGLLVDTEKCTGWFGLQGTCKTLHPKIGQGNQEELDHLKVQH